MSKDNNHKDKARRIANRFHIALRQKFRTEHGDRDDLPDWLRAARVSIGRLPGGTIILYEARMGEENKLAEYREVTLDTEFLFPEEPTGDQYTLISMEPVEDPTGANVIDNSEISISPSTTLTNLGEIEHQNILQLIHCTLNYGYSDVQARTRFIPLALFVPDEHFDLKRIWNLCSEHLITVLSESQ